MLCIATLTFWSVLNADACTFLLTSLLSTALARASRATICKAAHRREREWENWTTPKGSLLLGMGATRGDTRAQAEELPSHGGRSYTIK